MAISSLPSSIGALAPSFSLLDVKSNQRIGLDDFPHAKGYAIFFICNHCPYVIHLQKGLVEFAHDYQRQGIAVLAISANDVLQYPEDGPELMKKMALEAGYPFPYLFDETQAVAKAYRATCTPDLFLFDQDRKLIYRGEFDPSRRGNSIPVTGSSFRKAADCLLEGKPVPPNQIPSIGCHIKWKPGQEPDYFNPPKVRGSFR